MDATRRFSRRRRIPTRYALISANPAIDPAHRREKVVLGGRDPEPARSPSGLPLPHALSAHAGALPSGGAKAAHYGWGAIRRVPLSAGARVMPIVAFQQLIGKTLFHSSLRHQRWQDVTASRYLRAISRATAGAEVGASARNLRLPPPGNGHSRSGHSGRASVSFEPAAGAFKPSGQRWNGRVWRQLQPRRGHGRHAGRICCSERNRACARRSDGRR